MKEITHKQARRYLRLDLDGLLGETQRRDLEAQLEYEAMLQGVAGKTKDYHEGVKAFLEKRQPEFMGE